MFSLLQSLAIDSPRCVLAAATNDYGFKDPLLISIFCSVRPPSPSGDLSSDPSPATQIKGFSQDRRDREEPTNVRLQGTSFITIAATS